MLKLQRAAGLRDRGTNRARRRAARSSTKQPPDGGEAPAAVGEPGWGRVRAAGAAGRPARVARARGPSNARQLAVPAGLPAGGTPSSSSWCPCEATCVPCPPRAREEEETDPVFPMTARPGAWGARRSPARSGGTQAWVPGKSAGSVVSRGSIFSLRLSDPRSASSLLSWEQPALPHCRPWVTQAVVVGTWSHCAMNGNRRGELNIPLALLGVSR